VRASHTLALRDMHLISNERLEGAQAQTLKWQRFERVGRESEVTLKKDPTSYVETCQIRDKN